MCLFLLQRIEQMQQDHEYALQQVRSAMAEELEEVCAFNYLCHLLPFIALLQINK